MAKKVSSQKKSVPKKTTAKTVAKKAKAKKVATKSLRPRRELASSPTKKVTQKVQKKVVKKVISKKKVVSAKAPKKAVATKKPAKNNYGKACVQDVNLVVQNMLVRENLLLWLKLKQNINQRHSQLKLVHQSQRL